jgi:CRP-like cAMP-binding protein
MNNKLIKCIKQLWPFKPTPAIDPKLIKYLKKQPLFKHTPEAVLVKIASKIKMRSLAKGDVLLRQGDASKSLFLIRTGWVKIIAESTAGEGVVLNQYGPGHIVGEMSLIDQEPRSSTIVALRPTEVMEMKYDAVLELLDEHPVLVRSFLREMSTRIRFANAYIEESIEWCRRIGAGDYDFVQEQIEQTQSTIVDMTYSDQARASAFLSVFFRMANDIKKREEDLKRQVQQLIIEIDEVKRQQQVKELTETEFFDDLQVTAQKLREERRAKIKKQSEKRDATES